jgi:hypothetical protein
MRNPEGNQKRQNKHHDGEYPCIPQTYLPAYQRPVHQFAGKTVYPVIHYVIESKTIAVAKKSHHKEKEKMEQILLPIAQGAQHRSYGSEANIEGTREFEIFPYHMNKCGMVLYII